MAPLHFAENHHPEIERLGGFHATLFIDLRGHEDLLIKIPKLPMPEFPVPALHAQIFSYGPVHHPGSAASGKKNQKKEKKDSHFPMLPFPGMRTKSLFPFLIALSALQACATAQRPQKNSLSADRDLSSETLAWKKLGGVESAVWENRLLIVRGNLRQARLSLLNPPLTSGQSLGSLAQKNSFVAATNAAMFARDYVTSIGYMRTFDRVNNPRVNPRLRGFLLFDPVNASNAPVKIGSKADLPLYQSAFQSHRMIDEKSNVLWKQGKSVYRQVGLVGVDTNHRVLFFHHPGLVDVHDLVKAILSLKLRLTGLLYLDGGSHGALYLSPELGPSSNTWISLPNLLALESSSGNEID